jgi:CelD/BcsL family acetyltransferase involved in cellulose biosynthesis
MKLRAEFLRPAEIGLEMSPAWDDLAAHASEPNIFLERWFMEASLKHLPHPDGLRIAFVSDGGQLIGVAAFFMARRYGRMILRHVQSWSHYHSFLGAPLVRKDREADFWTALITAIDGEDWADGLIHFNGLVEHDRVHAGLVAAMRKLGRSCDIVHRSERALLKHGLDAQSYYETHMRKKKRKEIGRLRARLAELGNVRFNIAKDEAGIAQHAAQFLSLEEAGWKGKAGSALASSPDTEAFFLDLIAGGSAANRVEMLRLCLDEKPIAMMVNFLALPGSFSYKIAFDEDYARFSPGVLIQLENLSVLERQGFEWMDSCAVENHPMINSLWAERCSIIRVSIPLSGLKRGMVFRFCRTAEDSWAQVKKIKSVPSRIIPQDSRAHEAASL